MSRNSAEYVCEECKDKGIVEVCEHRFGLVPEWKQAEDIEKDKDEVSSCTSSLPELLGDANFEDMDEHIVVTRASIKAMISFLNKMIVRKMTKHIEIEFDKMKQDLVEYTIEFMMNKDPKGAVMTEEGVMNAMTPSEPKKEEEKSRRVPPDVKAMLDAGGYYDEKTKQLVLPMQYLMTTDQKMVPVTIINPDGSATYFKTNGIDVSTKGATPTSTYNPSGRQDFATINPNPGFDKFMSLLKGNDLDVIANSAGLDVITKGATPISIHNPSGRQDSAKIKPLHELVEPKLPVLQYTDLELPEKQSANSMYHYFKDILQQTKKESLPSTIYIHNPDNVKMLCTILLHHPNAKQKIGNGVKCFFIRRSITRDGKDICCFYVQRMDNTEEDFSYHICFGKRSWKDDGTHFDSAAGKLLPRKEDE